MSQSNIRLLCKC